MAATTSTDPMTAPDTDRLQPFERYPALASWVERLGNSHINISLAEWMIFVGALNNALTRAEGSAHSLEADNARLLGEVETLRLNLEAERKVAREAEGAAFRNVMIAVAAEAALERAREGLEPFARVSDNCWNETRAEDPVWLTDECGQLKDEITSLKVADFRRAAEVCASLKTGGGDSDAG